MVDWQQIDTVLLDMDGTLLDLHYDTFFWLEYLPKKYAEKHAISIAEANSQIQPMIQKLRGKLEWYCTDHWSDVLKMDIPALKAEDEVSQKIGFRPEAENFLSQLQASKKPTWLVTNAHPDVVAIKFGKLPLDQYFEKVVTSHQYGFPKESSEFWSAFQAEHGFAPEKSLFVDDSLSVLRSAKRYGIGHLRAISVPDSTKPKVDTAEFTPLDLSPTANGLI
jgi:HAD superfamily hydrolase (TIGR01509 family)